MNDVLYMHIIIILDINFDIWLEYKRHLHVLVVEKLVL